MQRSRDSELVATTRVSLVRDRADEDMWDVVLFPKLLNAAGGLSLLASYLAQRLYAEVRVVHCAPHAGAPAAVCEITTSSRTAAVS